MSRLTRDGTAEPVSRDQILRHARGQGDIHFPVQLTTSRIGNLTRLIHTLLYVMTIHTYIHTYIVSVFGLPYRRRRRRFESPWIGPMNTASKRVKLSTVTLSIGATSTLSASSAPLFLAGFRTPFLFPRPSPTRP